ncbi:hypothetical protein A2I98_02835 [Pseudoalteromonas agarivorans]|uniref:KAP NTPase domain-containing protein n=1 Tax=Pseudoalteromonas agarivorans TaxID=176102 RepID=A0ABR5VP62_9GAMM|nr:P-loop NTPase fold protein [Pseudoalteromonas telluritireducens]KYL31942.1 hypothetical protein A2I98_02835 [Pseudoalteromonas telluritireducens]
MSNSNYNFNWSSDITCHFSGDVLPNDALERSTQARFLTSFTKKYKESSYVLNLNSDWGAGKTYFIKRWANSIRDHHPVVYIDAWSNDFHNDPLTLVISHIIRELKKIGINSDKALLENIVLTSCNLIKNTTFESFKGVLKKQSGIDLDNIQASYKSEKAAHELKLEGLASDLINITEEQESAVKQFKLAVSSFLDEIITEKNSDNKNRWSPLYIFVDELDRCRPTFAIETLEVIKHIFSIKKVIFIVATDSKQLEHSIKVIYGSGFDSKKYLERFFNRSFTLIKPDLSSFIAIQEGFTDIVESLKKTNSFELVEWTDDSVLHFISALFNCLSLDLRTTSQIIDRTSSIINFNDGCIGTIWLIFLESIRSYDSDIYTLLINGKIRTDDATFHSALLDNVKSRIGNHALLNSSVLIGDGKYTFSSLLVYMARVYSKEVNVMRDEPKLLEIYLDKTNLGQNEISNLMNLSAGIS